MHWLHDLSCFFGGAFLANAIPHTVSGLMGRSFQTPFARPRGVGHSSAVLNVIWGAFNLACAWYLLHTPGVFSLRRGESLWAAATGALLLGLGLAYHFGRFNGGRTPHRP